MVLVLQKLGLAAIKAKYVEQEVDYYYYHSHFCQD